MSPVIITLHKLRTDDTGESETAAEFAPPDEANERVACLVAPAPPHHQSQRQATRRSCEPAAEETDCSPRRCSLRLDDARGCEDQCTQRHTGRLRACLVRCSLPESASSALRGGWTEENECAQMCGSDRIAWRSSSGEGTPATPASAALAPQRRPRGEREREQWCGVASIPSSWRCVRTSGDGMSGR